MITGLIDFITNSIGWVAATTIKYTLKVLKIAVPVTALALAIVWTVVDFNGYVGLLIGLVLGTLTIPARVAGVDFRQWFRDPGTPSEMGDDTWIGLMKFGFHMLATVAFVALLGVIVIASARPPGSCVAINISKLVWLGGFGEWLGHIVNTCTAWTTWYKIIGGAAIGLGAMQALGEFAAWRPGLRWKLPKPVRATEYLVTRSPPRVRAKLKVPGHRRLIVCCDGTWNWPEWQLETNVVRLVRALEPDDGGNPPIPQIIHYHQGVGTGNFLDSWLGGGTGVGLTASVKACYGFLVDNYREGDEIFLFGFSRGAYVARALSGLIFQVGIMRKGQMERFSEIWDWYRQEKKDRKRKDLDDLAGERHANVDIECVGVWDTVGAMGVPGMRACAGSFKFHDASLGWHVRHAFQALAIDEQRGNFQAAIWAPFDDSKLDPNNPEDAPFIPPKTNNVQTIKQVWFPGVHSSIGGGYPQRGLSDASFLWMLAQLHERGLLCFNEKCVNAALARDEDEYYPGGAMMDSRTAVWRIGWAPVPRPVCIVSDTEYIHDSVWARDTWLEQLDIQKDPYGREARRHWRRAMCAEPQPLSRHADLEKYEEIINRVRSSKITRRDFKVINTFCSRMLSNLSQKN